MSAGDLSEDSISHNSTLEKFFWFVLKQETFTIGAQLLCSKQMGQLMYMYRGRFQEFPGTIQAMAVKSREVTGRKSMEKAYRSQVSTTFLAMKKWSRRKEVSCRNIETYPQLSVDIIKMHNML